MDVKIVEKIQKLLALSESSNQHEAELSMLKAQEILAKHKLSLKEVMNFKIYDSAIKNRISNISFTKAKWKARLAQLIADNFGCYMYFKTRNSRIHTVTFFGREEDIEVCNIVFEYAIDCIGSTVKRIKYDNIKLGLSTRGLENDYAQGFINGLRDKFEEQKQNNQEWGLVLVKDAGVVEAYKDLERTFTRTINTDMRFQGNYEVYNQGLKDGRKFSISDKIAEGDNEEVLSLASGNPT